MIKKQLNQVVKISTNEHYKCNKRKLVIFALVA